LSLSPRGNVDKSRMYKKLHTPEKEPSAEPFCDKGSFLGCVPERVIMLTKIEYDIQLENRKNSTAGREFFLHTFVVRTMLSDIMSSLLKLLYVIHIDNLPKNKSMNIM
jgi:hypothetical protein